jgi:hypothetical protein
MDHYSSGEPLFSEAGAQGRSDTAIHEDDDEVRSVRVMVGTHTKWKQVFVKTIHED